MTAGSIYREHPRSVRAAIRSCPAAVVGAVGAVGVVVCVERRGSTRFFWGVWEFKFPLTKNEFVGRVEEGR